MKKLFTLCFAIFLAFALNAQLTNSGNGFKEMFDYTDGTVLSEVTYEGLTVEWPVSSNTEVQSGVLTWSQDAGEVSFGFMEVDAPLDLSGDNATLSFKYQVPAESVINIWFMDGDFNEGWIELSIVAGTTELQAITVDLLSAESISEVDYDLSKIIELYILPELAAAGTCYLDEILLGDASATSGLKRVSVQNNLEIYPNPASTQVSIGVDASSVSIFNTVGKEVYSTTNYRKGTPINVEDFNSGLYFIKADNNTQKLLIR